VCRTGGVHETTGVDAHLGAPVMHTGWIAYPAAPERLTAPPHGRPWHRSHLGRGGERPPQSEGLVRARARARFHTPGPAPSGVAPLQLSLREGQQSRDATVDHPFGGASTGPAAIFGRVATNVPTDSGSLRGPDTDQDASRRRRRYRSLHRVRDWVLATHGAEP